MFKKLMATVVGALPDFLICATSAFLGGTIAYAFMGKKLGGVFNEATTTILNTCTTVESCIQDVPVPGKDEKVKAVIIRTPAMYAAEAKESSKMAPSVDKPTSPPVEMPKPESKPQAPKKQQQSKQ